MRSNQAFCPAHPSPLPLVLSLEKAEENSFVSASSGPRLWGGGWGGGGGGGGGVRSLSFTLSPTPAFTFTAGVLNMVTSLLALFFKFIILVGIPLSVPVFENTLFLVLRRDESRQDKIR